MVDAVQFNQYAGGGPIEQLNAALGAVQSRVNALNTPIVTVGAGVLTGAGIVGGVISRGGVQTANFSDATDTAANIILANSGAVIGNSWTLVVLNNTTFQETITAGAGVTLSGKNFVIGPNGVAQCLVTYTGAGAVSILVEAVEDQGLNNLNAATDPGVANDNTQGYGPGSLWINTVGGRVWVNSSAPTGAAVWVLASGAATLPVKNTAIATVGAGTLTAAAMVGGVITRSGSTTAFTDTTDTAANIIAAMSNQVVGQSWYLDILNTTVAQQTIAAGVGVTLSGVQQIAQNCRGTFLVTYTGAGAVSMFGLSIVDRGIDTFNAAADPTTANDNTQGFGVGSIWFNTTAGALRWWECRSAATGAAAWVFSGADYANGGTNPPTEITQFGASTAAMSAEGNINRQISAAGINPGAIGADNVLAVFSIPASAFDGIGNRGIAIQANGGFAATATNKEVKIIVNPATAVVGSTVGAGGTTLADTGVSAGNNVGWQVNAEVYKYGAAGSNTQLGVPGGSMVGLTHGGLGNGVAGKPQAITAVESGAILVAITGNATTATTDIVFNFMNINALN